MFEASMPPLSAMDDDNAGSAGDIDGMAADEVLSVIGNAIFSQHPELFSPTDDADVNAIVDAAPTPQKATTMRELPAARPPQSPTVARGGLGACIPGSFTCEAHGLRPGYFACDSAGLALPASCGAADVCYQRQHLIVCGAPGKYL
ncbi:hypothetical protein IWW55_006276 [Coemansia sp. RSA 2706]|nr:hypothetical protein LPJ70_001814 [Coemansia sp. RSA 2708]KAJ2289513.1 hypothetical protein IWW55_006276 [Coemansia sp. RSA 2706]